MAKYILTVDGVKNAETGACIPDDPGNRQWQAYQDWLAAGNTPIPAQPSPYHQLVGDQWVADLETVRQARIDEAYKIARQKMDALVAEYSPGEMAAWPRLENEARQYLAEDADPNITTPTIGPTMQSELDAGSRYTAAELAQVVVAKADGLRTARAAIIAARQAHVAALEAAAATVDDLIAYDLSVGW